MAILQSTSITGSLVVSGSSIDFTDATGINISSITGDGSELTNINASNISSGTISDARLPGSISSDITGNAATATKWATARTITLGGDLTGNVSIDGSANVTLTATVADDSHNHIISNVDGLQTALDGKLSLTGGTITSGGSIGLTINHNDFAEALVIHRNHSDNAPAITFKNNTGQAGILYVTQADGALRWRPLATSEANKVFHDDYHPNADKWTNGRTLTIGDTGKTVDGSGNVSWSRAELGITKTNIDALNIDADTIDGLNSAQFLRSDANDTTTGFIAAGDANGTNGSKVLRQRYSGGDGDNIIASIGTMHSSGNWLFGYGIDPKNGSSGYISSFDNFSGKRSAIELGNDYIELHYAPTQATAVGSDITSLSTPFVFDLTNTRMGIGETTPSAQLHVSGSNTDVLVESSTGASRYMLKTSTGEWRIGTNAVQNNNFWIYEPTLAEYVFNIDTSGNVGIGTTSPSNLLDLESSATSGTQLHIVNTSSGGSDWRLVSAGSANSINAGYFGLYNSTWRMVVDASGNVGIGETTPDSLLHLSGSSNNAILTLENNGNGNVSGINFVRERSTGPGVTGGSIFIESNTGHSHASMYLQTQTASADAGVTSALSNNNGVRVILGGGSGVGSFIVENGSSESLRINRDGNVGIGTSNPEHKVHIGPNSGTVKLALEWSDGNGATSGEAYSTIYTSGQGGAYPFSGRGNLILQPRNDDSDGFGDLVVMTGATAVPRFIVQASGNTIVKNDLTVQGKVTAEEFHTEFVSASIIYQSGSTKFGNSNDDNHDFTGSLNVNAVTTQTIGVLRSSNTSTSVNNGGALLVIRNSSNTDGNQQSLIFQNSNGSGTSGIFGYNVTQSTGEGLMTFGVRNSSGTFGEKMRIDGAGNVGIGTTSPDTPLHVTRASNGTVAKFERTAFDQPNEGAVVSIELGENTGPEADPWVDFVNNGTSGGGPGIISSIAPIDGEEGTRLWSKGGIAFDVGSSLAADLSNEKVRITSVGNVGIGTTSPGVKLEVETDTISAEAFRINNSIEKTVEIGHVSDGAPYLSLITGSATTILLRTDGGDNYINAGNVGIGTTNPEVKLDVRGLASVGDATPKSDWYTTAYYGLEINGGGAVWGRSTDTHLSSNYYVKATPSAQDTYMTTNEAIDLWLNNGTGDLSIRTAASGTAGTAITWTTPFIIKNSGNVGIGTTNPGGILDVQDSTTGNMLVRVWNTDSSGTGAAALRIANSGNNANGNRIEFSDANYYTATISGDRSQGLVFRTSATGTNPATIPERMRIVSSGDVGIGTTSPSSKLDVYSLGGTTSNNALTLRAGNSLINFGSNQILFGWNGSANYRHAIKTRHNSESGTGNAIDFYVWNQGTDTSGTIGTKHNLTLENGNVGIGTTSPSEKLEVAGNISIGTSSQWVGRDSETNSFGFNASSGQYINSTANISLAIDSNNTDADSRYFRIIKNASSYSSGTELFRVQENGNVGIGVTNPSAKLAVTGTIIAGGKVSYTKTYSSLNTTGEVVAGLSTGFNGSSSLFEFTCKGGSGQYQKIVYSCNNAGGTWYPKKVVDEGTNGFDVVSSGNGTTVTFTFKGRTASQAYSPGVHIEAFGNSINSTYYS